ncbi:MAG: hypothetical protein IJR20_07275 [Muribaculaceae bacterium]|nr:hypothetical protein [Muribaculaceae bacterium]
MRNNIFLICLFIAVTAQAQMLNVQSIDKVTTPSTEMAKQVAAISPKGDYLLLCSQSQEGLMKLDLATGENFVLTTARGAGFNTKIGNDGRDVVFQEVTIGQDRLLMRGVKTIDLRTSKVRSIIAPTRELHGFDIPDGIITAVVENKVKTLDIDPRVISRPVVSNCNLKLMLTINGETQYFTPNGDQFNYIWPSISPNGTRVLYYVSELGCFTCNIDGSDMVKLGELRAPQWLDDTTVVGMRDLDDGITITSSSIVAKNIDGTEQILTGDDVTAIFPQVASKAGKIAFSTLQGDIYIINYTK